MTERARLARAAYKRRWAQENRSRVKEYQARYWEKKAEEARINSAEPAHAEAAE